MANIGAMSIAGVPALRDPRPVAPFSYDERERGFLQFFIQFDSFKGPHSASIGGKSFGIPELGLGLMSHEDGVNCTAQHVPGRVPAGRSLRDSRSRGRGGISTLDVAPSILAFFDVVKADYMVGKASIRLNS